MEKQLVCWLCHTPRDQGHWTHHRGLTSLLWAPTLCVGPCTTQEASLPPRVALKHSWISLLMLCAAPGTLLGTASGQQCFMPADDGWRCH